MSITQISKIQVRSGNLQDLPQLSVGEFGWAVDARRLFIGNDPDTIGPIPDNTELLTSFSNGGLFDAAGNTTEIQFNFDGKFAASPNLTWNGTTLEIIGDLEVTGNSILEGNVIYINKEIVNIIDPVIQVGGGPNGEPLTSNDGKDRGLLLHYYVTNQGPVNAFMGWDTGKSEFAFGSNVGIFNDVIIFYEYGNVRVGNILGNVYGNLYGNVYGDTAELTTSVTVGTPNIAGTISATGSIDGREVLTTNGIFFNSNTISGNVAFPVGYNGMSVGNIVMDSTANVTLSDGRWVII
jgi:hypothetical protein